jgi:hypothetical protein
MRSFYLHEASLAQLEGPETAAVFGRAVPYLVQNVRPRASGEEGADDVLTS